MTQSVAPYLTAHNADAAIAFIVAAFGGAEEFRVVGDDGRIGHAQIVIGDSTIMISDEYPDFGAVSPKTLGGSSVAIHLGVDDCDATFGAATPAGASGDRPPSDEPHGSRVATVTDPFGHRWMLSETIQPFNLDDYAANAESGFRVEPNQ